MIKTKTTKHKAITRRGHRHALVAAQIARQRAGTHHGPRAASLLQTLINTLEAAAAAYVPVPKE